MKEKKWTIKISCKEQCIHGRPERRQRHREENILKLVATTLETVHGIRRMDYVSA